MYDVGEVLPNLNPPILLFGLLMQDQAAEFKDHQYFRLYGIYSGSLQQYRCLWVTVRYAQKIKQNVPLLMIVLIVAKIRHNVSIVIGHFHTRVCG